MSAVVRRLRRPIPSGLRFDVLNRDRSTCQYCGRSAPAVELHVDHYIPVAAGGPNRLWNLLCACVDCNSGKSSKRSVRIMVRDWQYEITGFTWDGKHESLVHLKVSDPLFLDGHLGIELDSYYSRRNKSNHLGNSAEDILNDIYLQNEGRILMPGKEYHFKYDLDKYFEKFRDYLNVTVPELMSSILECCFYKKNKSSLFGEDDVKNEFFGHLSPGIRDTLCWAIDEIKE